MLLMLFQLAYVVTLTHTDWATKRTLVNYLAITQEKDKYVKIK